MFTIDDEEIKNKTNADIRVIGVGGGGGNVIETMIQNGITGVKFIAINTDAQALSTSTADKKIQLGVKLTKGLGAGANPDIGRRAAMESYEDIVSALDGADMVFVTAGMGGGTGTGGIPVVAEIAKELGTLTVGVVTTPFLFEGKRRKNHAEKGIMDLKKHVDTLIVIPNEKLLTVSDENTPLLKTFQKTDDVLLQAVKGIAELISLKGLINLDFADVKTVMKNKGMALMGIGVGSGKDRAMIAVKKAVCSPLLDDISIQGATGIIVNITAGADLSLREVNEATSLITKVVDPDADIIVGTVIDEKMSNDLSVTVIATGFVGEISFSKGNNLFFEQDEEKTQEIKNDSYVEKNEEPAPEKEKDSEESVMESSSEESFKEDEEDTISTEEEPEIKKEEIKEEPAQSIIEQSTDKKPSVHEILMKKAREYEDKKNQEPDKGETEEQKGTQIEMDWVKPDSGDEANDLSPFETDISFTEEDVY